MQKDLLKGTKGRVIISTVEIQLNKIVPMARPVRFAEHGRAEMGAQKAVRWSSWSVIF